MPDPISIEVVRRLIEEEDIWLLYERSCEEEACLLSSGEARYDTQNEVCKLDLLRRSKIHRIEYFEDITIDIMCITARVFTEIFPECEFFIFSMHDLTSYANMLSSSHEDTSFLWFILSSDHLEDRGLSSAILTHEGDFRSFTYREARLIEEPLRCDISIGDFVKANNDVSFCHNTRN